MTTAAYNADNPFAVAVVVARGSKTGQTSYVLCHQPKSFDWRERNPRRHPWGAGQTKLSAAAVKRLHAVFGVSLNGG